MIFPFGCQISMLVRTLVSCASQKNPIYAGQEIMPGSVNWIGWMVVQHRFLAEGDGWPLGGVEFFPSGCK